MSTVKVLSPHPADMKENHSENNARKFFFEFMNFFDNFKVITVIPFKKHFGILYFSRQALYFYEQLLFIVFT